MVIVAEQMQNAVNQIADDFGGPGGAEATGLVDGFVHANENFAVQIGSRFGVPSFAFRVVEGDDVGGAAVLEKDLIESRHFRRGYQIYSQLGAVNLREFLEQLPPYRPKKAQINGEGSLLVSDRQRNLEGGSAEHRRGGFRRLSPD